MSVIAVMPFRQPFQRVISIPRRIMHDEMLRQLGLPSAQYEHVTSDDKRIYVVVHFQVPRLYSEDSLVTVRICGQRSTDLAVADDTASEAAIRYMQYAANAVIKDLTYNRFIHMQEENRRLKLKLTDIKSQLRKAKVKIERLARGWFWSLRNMFSFSAQFQNVAAIALYGGQEDVADDMKEAFGTIYKAAEDLNSKSVLQETKLEEIRHS